MKKAFLIFVLLFSAAAPLSAQNKPAAFSVKSEIINASQLLKDVETLSADAMQGRGIGTKGGETARQYVEKRFRESGIKPFAGNYLQPFEFTNRAGAKINGVNVTGFIEGRKLKDKYIVISAHYDHVGIQKGEIYNGADDNASGTAALFAIAEYFTKKKPDHTIIFAAFDGEESGLRGARAFLETPPVALTSIALNLNMDMIAHNDVNELYAVGTYANPQLKSVLEKVAKKSKVKLLFGHEGPNVSKENDWTNQSDQGAFNNKKIPFVYFGVEDHKDYHKPTDDFANINRQFYVSAAETVLEAAKGFDKDLK